MNEPRRRVVLGALGALALAACGRRDPERAVAPARLPPLALQHLDGAPLRFAPPLERAVLINFWATWCAPCRAEMASLEALSRALAGELSVIGVSVDADRNLAREFLLKQGVTFRNFIDPGSRASRGALAIEVLPETLLVAADGRLLARMRGARPWDAPGVVIELRARLRAAA